MKTFSLPSDLLKATLPGNPDPLNRYAALQVVWAMNPLDVACRDLLVPGGKNSLPVPSEADWPTVLAHRQRWEEQIEHARTVVITENN